MIDRIENLRIEFGTFSDGDSGATVLIVASGKWNQDNPVEALKEIIAHVHASPVVIRKQLDLFAEHPPQADGDAGESVDEAIRRVHGASE